MQTATYRERRGELEAYFDRTAVDAWRKLTSDVPVGRIRATVRAGRDRMRNTLLSWLPEDLSGRRVLDAGCGTGAMAVALAERGAEVTAVDLSPTLVELARERAAADGARGGGPGRITFVAGDMLDPAFGSFDHVVAMDSLIHYGTADLVGMIGRLSERTERSLLFTVAPRTPALAAMHALGRVFPRGNRAPAIVPVAETRLQRLLDEAPGLSQWRRGWDERVLSGFYISQAQEIYRP